MNGLNKRRNLVIALGANAILLPLRSLAQQPGKIWRVGILSVRHVDFLDSDNYYGPFRQGMRELGYVDGKNLAIEWRSAEGKYERLPDLAADLVRVKVDVIVTNGTSAVRAAQKATTTIPIVFGSAGDPVRAGLIKSLSRPGGNITGLTNMSGDLGPKHFEMLHSIVPKLSRVAVLLNPANAGQAPNLKAVQTATQKSGVKILPVEARNPQEIESAFSTMTRRNATAVLVINDAVFTQQLRQIAELAIKNRLPAIVAHRQFAEVGGLMSYGPSAADQYRRAAIIVDKILKGAKPADLPVEQPTKFELIINGKTAKALGLTIPQSLLVSADKVIE